MTPQEEFYAKASEQESKRLKTESDQAKVRAAFEREQRKRAAYEKKREAAFKTSGLSHIFDTSLRQMIAPELIRAMYFFGVFAILTASVIGSYSNSIDYFKQKKIWEGLGIAGGCIVVGLVSVILWRVFNELLILAFNIYETLQEIRDKDDSTQESQPISTPTPSGMKVYTSP